MAVLETEELSERIFTIPNIISFFRLLMVPVFAALIFLEKDLWALLVLAVSGFSDWLDGILARKLNQVSELGKLLIPLPIASSFS